MGKERFFTRAAANAGHRFPLFDPATGEETGDWLLVLGVDSDAFRAEKRASSRRQADAIADLPPGDKAAALVKLRELEVDERRAMVASLVAGWSFDEPCTRAAVVELLREAPQLLDAIDEVATKRAVFLKGASSNSPASPSGNSGSTSAPKEASKAPEQA